MIEQLFDRIAHGAAPTGDLATWVLEIPQVPSLGATWYGHRRLCTSPFVQQRRFIRHFALIADASRRMTHLESGSKASWYPFFHDGIVSLAVKSHN